MPSRASWLLCLALSFFSLAAFALDEGSDHMPSSVQLQGGRDNAGGSFGDVSADVAVKNKDLISAGASTSRVKDQATQKSSSTRSFFAAYSFHPEDEWSVTPSVQIWGARSDLTTRSALLDYTRNFEAWSIGLQPEVKTLVWTSTENLKEKKRTGAAGLHLHAEYGIGDWMFQVHGGGLNYGGQKFDHFVDSYFATDSALAQSSGLVKSYVGGSVSYHHRNLTLNLGGQRTTYVIDGVAGNSLNAGIKYRVHQNWTLGYEFSHSKVNSSPDINSNALNLAYYW